MTAMRIVHILNTLRRLPPLSKLSGDEERMLFELRELFSRQGRLSLGDVYNLIPSQSPSTSYRQLMALKACGLVDVATCVSDRRQRRVSFTRDADTLFRKLSQ